MNKAIVFDTKAYDEQYSLTVETIGDNDFPGWVDISFYPDDSLILYSTYGKLYIWDYMKKTLLKTLDNPNPNGAAVAFYNGNENVALLGTSIILNLETGNEIESGIDINSEIREKTAWIVTDNREYILTNESLYKNGQKDETIINIYDRDTQEIIGTYTHNNDSFMGSNLTSDGKLLSIGYDEGVQIIDFSIPESPKVVSTYLFDGKILVKGLEFTKDGKKLILATSREVLVYDISDLNTRVENAALH